MVDDPARFSSTYEDEFNAQLVKQLGLDDSPNTPVGQGERITPQSVRGSSRFAGLFNTPDAAPEEPEPEPQISTSWENLRQEKPEAEKKLSELQAAHEAQGTALKAIEPVASRQQHVGATSSDPASGDASSAEPKPKSAGWSRGSNTARGGWIVAGRAHSNPKHGIAKPMALVSAQLGSIKLLPLLVASIAPSITLRAVYRWIYSARTSSLSYLPASPALSQRNEKTIQVRATVGPPAGSPGLTPVLPPKRKARPRAQPNNGTAVTEPRPPNSVTRTKRVRKSRSISENRRPQKQAEGREEEQMKTPLRSHEERTVAEEARDKEFARLKALQEARIEFNDARRNNMHPYMSQSEIWQFICICIFIAFTMYHTEI